MLVLVPLTIDRFLAIVFPLQHRYMVTFSRSVFLVLLTWIPSLFLLFFDTIMYIVGQKQVCGVMY